MTYHTVGGVDVSRETYEQLREFSDLAQKWTQHINLVAKSTMANLWDRHIADSVQLYPLAPSAFDSWVDIGSGGGFPGIVLSIVAKERNPQANFTLIESDHRKCSFLQTAKRNFGLNVTIVTERIEAAAPVNADVASARALAGLAQLLPLISRHMSPKGTAILPKGRRYANEIAEARRSWAFSLEEHPSLTDPDARLLVLEGIHLD